MTGNKPFNVFENNRPFTNRLNDLDKLIHQVFDQNEQGKELLKIWKEALIMSPTVTANSTQFQCGIAEGKKEFIRNILLTIKSVGDINV